MNEEIITDLKQFIAATVSRQLSQQLTEKLAEQTKVFRAALQETNRKIDDLSASVALALETSNDATSERLDTHERRIRKLEQRIA